MATCAKCGTRIEKDYEFCPSCGTSITQETKKPIARERHVQEDICFGEGRRRDWSGLVSFGILLIIVGIVFLTNPNIIADFRLWIEQLANQKTLIRPPQTLISSAMVFFGLIGLSNFFMAGIRFVVFKAERRVLADMLSGIALVLFSYLIYLYGIHALAWQIVLAVEVVACGFLIILYTMARHLFRKGA